MADPKVQVEFFRQMREISLDGFHFGSNIPHTAYRDELQRGGQDAVMHRYLADMARRESKWSDDMLRFSATELVDKVRKWASDDSITTATVGKQLSALGFSAAQTKINGRNTRRYDLESRAKVVEALSGVPA